MNKNHEEWLKEYLNNLTLTNKSQATHKNYECDLRHFINWYEKNHSQLLNHANAQTIGMYKQYLAKDENLSANLMATETDINPYPKKNIIHKVKSFFKFIFKKNKNDIYRQSKHQQVEFKHNQTLFSQQRSPLRISSQRRHLSSIKNFYEYLKQANEDRNNLFNHNPVKSKIHAIKLKDIDVENTKLLTLKDWQRLERSIYRPMDRLIIFLLYYGGLRLQEVSHLKIEYFNPDNKTITFPRKGGQIHQLKLQKYDEINLHLQRHLNTRENNSHYLFPGRNTGPLTTRAMYKRILKYFIIANCPTRSLSPHSFRKACATNLYRKTKDLLKVRDYLNHSDAKVTQTYIERS